MKLIGTGLKIAAFILALCCFRSAFAQGTDSVFRKEWEIIDSLIIKNDLTKTALAKVNLLYTKAQQRRLNDQVLKALLYRFSLEERITTDDPAHTIKLVQAELDRTTDIVQKAILHTMLARQYLRYFQDHRWQLYGRTQTKGLVKDDITTWGASDFTTAIAAHFQQALKPAAQLKQTKNAAYSAILIKGNHPEDRPTLFDLIAHEALDYFMSATPDNAGAVVVSALADTNVLQPAEIFINHKFARADSTDPHARALAIYQQLISFHSNDGNKPALVAVDLERIDWAHDNAGFPDKDLRYERALRNIIHDYPTVPETATAWYQLAQLEADKAENYKPFTDTANRFRYLNALRMIRDAVSRFPGIMPESPT
jgi:hypothetical protein